MVKEADATFQEVFSQVSLTDLNKLLPWCISSAVPLCYMSNALATAMQQDKDVPATSTVPKPEGSLAPSPPNSPAFQTWTLPLPVPPLPDIPFVGTIPVGCPFAGFIAGPTQKKWDHSSSGPLSNHHDKRTHVDSQVIETRNKHSSTQGDEDMPELVLEAEPSFEQWASPLPVKIDPDNGTVAESSRSTGDQASSNSDLSREKVADSDTNTDSGGCLMCLDTD